jgi:predicted GIY-YIG superfamily endonuclease
MSLTWVLYLLSGLDSNFTIRKTYVGITNNLSRRLRQHNGELSGGAKYTTSSRLTWRLECTVEGIDVGSIRRLEWRMHRPVSLKLRRGISCPLLRRLGQLSMALDMDRWTSTARPVPEVITEGMRICFHTPTAQKLWFSQWTT